MEIIHVSAECYPMAKVGGLADVVGALPKYQNQQGHIAKVVMPMYRTKFLYENEWEVVHKGFFSMEKMNFDFTIIKEINNKLGFDLYCVDINGLLDREKVYGYDDDTERFMAFQIAVMEWMSRWEHRPDIVHVHDHQAALIPFMMKYCYAYTNLKSIPSILTIHNAQYQGWMGWEKAAYLPAWDTWNWGLLDWNNTVNSLACGIKTAYRVNTVSPGYMKELMDEANGLENLFRAEYAKCTGIINGIDYKVWNPATDTYIMDNYSIKDAAAGKALNKKKLCDDFGLQPNLPLIIFIGRLVHEKAAELLPDAINNALQTYTGKINFLILGSGDPAVENALTQMNQQYVGYYNSQITYNEKLSHLMYAGADFLLMPSRVEPCGLNQLYALRYGTVPMVRRTGGLKDTVIDIDEQGGYGLCFNYASLYDIDITIQRALALYNDTVTLNAVRKTMMAIDNSWIASAEQYINLYNSVR
ncbi:glycogen synthase [Ferruginibacter yonginensis]|uniref:Glycogen synthase n=1 Tax=Ferruginibacter yonginensis TaxID=1310416 RepID=A0ABV8QPB1_9BACT